VIARQYIRKNAKIRIGSDGPIGNKILIIYGGSSKTRQIESGDTLDVEKTYSQEDMIHTLHENNVNLLSITSDLKTISKNLLTGEGTLGKPMGDNQVYDNIDAATTSLSVASAGAAKLFQSLHDFCAGLHAKGNLANELVNDTLLFNSLKAPAQQFRQIVDTANPIIINLQAADKDPKTPVGMLLHDKETATHFKELIKTLRAVLKNWMKIWRPRSIVFCLGVSSERGKKQPGAVQMNTNDAPAINRSLVITRSDWGSSR